MDGNYVMVPSGEYEELCDKADELERMEELAASGEMPDFDKMGFEELAAEAQYMWTRVQDMRCAIKCALSDMRDITGNLERFTEEGR